MKATSRVDGPWYWGDPLSHEAGARGGGGRPPVRHGVGLDASPARVSQGSRTDLKEAQAIVKAGVGACSLRTKRLLAERCPSQVIKYHKGSLAVCLAWWLC